MIQTLDPKKAIPIHKCRSGEQTCKCRLLSLSLWLFLVYQLDCGEATSRAAMKTLESAASLKSLAMIDAQAHPNRRHSIHTFDKPWLELCLSSRPSTPSKVQADISVLLQNHVRSHLGRSFHHVSIAIILIAKHGNHRTQLTQFLQHFFIGGQLWELWDKLDECHLQNKSNSAVRHCLLPDTVRTSLLTPHSDRALDQMHTTQQTCRTLHPSFSHSSFPSAGLYLRIRCQILQVLVQRKLTVGGCKI